MSALHVVRYAQRWVQQANFVLMPKIIQCKINEDKKKYTGYVFLSEYHVV